MKKGEDIVIKIAEDNNKVIFSNGFEHYILKKNSQDNFPWIKDKFIRHVIHWEDAFLLMTSKDYDRDIDIIHSENKDFNARFDRMIEPGLLQCYDSIIIEKPNKMKVMKTLIKIGDFLYLD